MTAPEWVDSIIRLLKIGFGWPIIAVLTAAVVILLPGRRPILIGLATLAVLMVTTAALPEPHASCPVQVGAADNGAGVNLAVGTECDILEVMLPGNSLSTGFSWDITGGLEPVPVAPGQSRPVLFHISTRFEPEGRTFGAGGLFTLRFKSVNGGATRLRLEYQYRAERAYGNLPEQDILFERSFGLSISVLR